MLLISVETMWLLVICASDLLLTVLLIITGYSGEANPILAYYLDYGLVWMVLIKLITFIGPLLIAEWYRRRNPLFIRNLLRITLFFYIFGYVLLTGTVNRQSLFASVGYNSPFALQEYSRLPNL